MSKAHEQLEGMFGPSGKSDYEVGQQVTYRWATGSA